MFSSVDIANFIRRTPASINRIGTCIKRSIYVQSQKNWLFNGSSNINTNMALSLIYFYSSRMRTKLWKNDSCCEYCHILRFYYVR